ncbi:hypothetical protein MKZ38_005196 [Zalerion maritima]|uniref:Uncharacterized protein n=1 Tax=Zalerion maritima TaxID=339359 RepID=A0AAD5WUW1_9PEZI|nr:hypothetical protein MKZ38_005196 [Zalerion maritima]
MRTTAYTTPLLLSLAAGALAVGPASPPGKAKVTRVDNFKWTNPFTSSLAESFSASCSSAKTFAATEYTLHDLFNPQPKGLLNWAESLKRIFTGRPFPGDWEGKDPHQYGRHLLKMKYSDVPIAVREWIENEEMNAGEGKGLFAVYPKQDSASHRINEPVAFKEGEIDRAGDEGKVAIFAPGAVYDILPLWVAEDSDCQDTLLDLSKYTQGAADGAVVSWTTDHTDPDMRSNKRDMVFTIKAEVLEAKPAAGKSVAEEAKEETSETAAEGKAVEETAEAKDEL